MSDEERDGELASLRDHWGEVYEFIHYPGGRWYAIPKTALGEPLMADTDGELRRQVRTGRSHGEPVTCHPCHRRPGAGGRVPHRRRCFLPSRPRRRPGGRRPADVAYTTPFLADLVILGASASLLDASRRGQRIDAAARVVGVGVGRWR